MIRTIDEHACGRVYYLDGIEQSQLEKIEGILGTAFAASAHYHAADKMVYTNKLPSEIEDRLKAAGFEPHSSFQMVV